MFKCQLVMKVSEKGIKCLYIILYVLNIIAIPTLFFCVRDGVGKIFSIIACICSLFTIPISYKQVTKNIYKHESSVH